MEKPDVWVYIAGAFFAVGYGVKMACFIGSWIGINDPILVNSYILLVLGAWSCLGSAILNFYETSTIQ